jgi:paraquat-inducible protein A
MTIASATAKNTSMASCHRCHLLCHLPISGKMLQRICPRCGADIHQRVPCSIQRTWALVIAALILYIPANVLPISITSAAGSAQGDTIMSGVIYFVQSGSWPVALVIFVASILVPVFKILILIFLLISVQRKMQWRPLDRTRLYRIIEAIGRWSMVDIFVITIMAALIKLKGLANFEAGPAAVYFAAVVVMTIFAAMSFDPRLIWDCVEDTHE